MTTYHADLYSSKKAVRETVMMATPFFCDSSIDKFLVKHDMLEDRTKFAAQCSISLSHEIAKRALPADDLLQEVFCHKCDEGCTTSNDICPGVCGGQP